MRFRHFLLSSASVVALVAALPFVAIADDSMSAPGLPAVSDVNGKIAGFAGSLGTDFTLGSTGSLSFPLAHQWGAQVDGMFGTAGGASFYGVGGHLFWRDPSKGLIGVTASTVVWDQAYTSPLPMRPRDDVNPLQDTAGATVNRFGVEGEVYLGRVSLEGALSYQTGTNTGLGGRATAAFYPTDDLRLDIGVAQLVGVGASLRGGAEWAPGGRHFSLFADASLRSTSTWSVLGGVRVYLGKSDKSLIRRHREDDPEGILPEDLYSVVGYGYCPIGTEGFFGFCDGNL